MRKNAAGASGGGGGAASGSANDSVSVAPANAEPVANADNDVEMDDDLDPASMYEDEEGGYRVGDIYIPPPIKPYCSSESQGSRLIITQIMNTNFKSYAGDVPLGPFCHVSEKCLKPKGKCDCRY